MTATFVRRKVLLLDDDSDLRNAYASHLAAHGFLVVEADSLSTALKNFESVPPDVAILDFRLADGTSLELLPKLKQLDPTVPVIVLTGFGSMELGVSLIKA